MAIPLNDLLGIAEPQRYKLHLACWNGACHPLDAFVADPDSWLAWNAWRGKRNDWTRPFILSFMDFYPQPDAWLFGGAFRVLARHPDGYELAPDERFAKYVGRLVASFHRYQGMRGRAFRLEKYLDRFTVRSLLPQVYTGDHFPGFEHLNHDFGMLEAIFRTERADWKAALQSVKGVYVITDKSNGKQYVGAAYGKGGVWSRWACYLGTGHGWNDALLQLVRDKGLPYARQNFRFALLEVMSKSTPDDAVLSREAHWKRALLTREHGYNRN